MKMKIIQINTSSSSFLGEDYEKYISDNWYARVACQLKKFYPNAEIECWTHERKYGKEKIKELKSLKFRIFPSTFGIRNSMEISLKMISALKKEIEECKK